jgi:thiamine transport system permease protein
MKRADQDSRDSWRMTFARATRDLPFDHLPLLFLALFFFYPLLSILRLSLFPEGKPALDALKELVQRPYYAETVWFTTWQAVLSTLLTLLIALPGAYVFGHFRFPGRDLLKALTTIPFVMPTVVVAAAFRALLGPHGQLNTILATLLNLDSPPIQLERTLWLILLAHVFYNYTVVIRIVGGFWANLSRHTEEAAAVLGANRRQVFRHITLPTLGPALLAAALLIFLFTFTSFGVILILGGPGFSTLETEIYRQAVVFLKFPVAAALSILQIVFTYGIMLVYTTFQRRITTPIRFQSQRQTLRSPTTARERLLVGLNVGLMLLLLLTPLLALVERSVTDMDGHLTLDYYRELPINRRGSVLHAPPLQVIGNSVRYALLTVLLATTLGALSAWRLAGPARDNPRKGTGGRRSRSLGWLDSLFMLPLGVSAVTLGFGYIVALGRLRTSPLLIPLAHTLIAFPFVVRTLLPVLRGIHPNLREAAAVLGASPGRVWREIDLPIVGRALLVGAVFAFTISMGEFGATSFIARPGTTTTLPIAINRFLGQPGALNFGQAVALSTVLMIVCGVGFLAIERFRYGEVGEF